MKPNLKQKAIALRKQGKTYSEILQEVSVAKSTLSLWLRGVGLSQKQEQRITEKRMHAQQKGAQARKDQRINLTKEIYQNAEKEIGKISQRELWLIGVALYWAEGSKEKKHRPSSPVEFSNSDPYMIKLFLTWLFGVFDARKEDISVGVYVHENNEYRIKEVIEHWSTCTGFPKEKFNYVYLKKHKIKTRRKNTDDMYYGNLRIVLKKSSQLNRKIAGWVRGINKNY